MAVLAEGYSWQSPLGATIAWGFVAAPLDNLEKGLAQSEQLRKGWVKTETQTQSSQGEKLSRETGHQTSGYGTLLTGKPNRWLSQRPSSTRSEHFEHNCTHKKNP